VAISAYRDDGSRLQPRPPYRTPSNISLSAALFRASAVGNILKDRRGKMSIPQNSGWKTRLVEREFPDRSFDIEFWQEQGDEAIFAAAWEMVELAEEVSHGQKTPTTKNCYNSYTKFEVEYLIHSKRRTTRGSTRAARRAGR
jgi:hypothetical protein